MTLLAIGVPGAIRIGTRGSALALVQAGLVADALRTTGARVCVETIVTAGDERAPDTAWGEGAFVTAIEQALLEGRVDVAVHSAKDVPTDEDPRLAIAAFLPREPAHDVLVLPGGRRIDGLDELAPGLRVGTDSPRRAAFLRAARPDLVVHSLHGNVDTRLRRLEAGETDALVLAAAGLRRLGRADRISLDLPFDEMPSAPGQGALAVQVRADDAATREIVGTIDDVATRRAVVAERNLLAAAGGGCRAPLGCLATDDTGAFRLRGGYATPDGRIAVTATGSTADDRAPDDDALVRATLRDLVTRACAAAAADGLPRVVVTRPVGDATAIALALIDRGYAPVLVPAIAIEPLVTPTADDLLRQLAHGDWVVVTSVNTVRALTTAAKRLEIDPARPGLCWAAVGAGTGRALRSAGIAVAFQPGQATAAALVEGLPVIAGETVIYGHGDLVDRTVAARLSERGARVVSAALYRTVEAPIDSEAGIRAAFAPRPGAVVMYSGSAVRGWLSLARASRAEAWARSINVVAVGPRTAAEARRHGLHVAAQAARPGPIDVAEAVIAATAAQPRQEIR
ncbi:MAG: hydroxymethylbilane synthase [Candidatus Limnocylindrales bacterium]